MSGPPDSGKLQLCHNYFIQVPSHTKHLPFMQVMYAHTYTIHAQKLQFMQSPAQEPDLVARN